MRSIFLFMFLSTSHGFIPNFKKKYTSKYRNKYRSLPSELMEQGAFIQDIWKYSDFLDELQKHHIEGATLIRTNNELTGLIVSDENTLHRIQFIPQLTNNIIDMITQYNIPFEFKENTNLNFGGPLQYIGLYFVISFVVSLLFRNPNNMNMMNPMNMLKQKNEIDVSEVDTLFEDVAGCDEAKFELVEVVDFLKKPEKYEEAGAKIPKGLLLEGPPGTGKTLLAKAVAGEAGVPFFYASGSQFIEMFVGVGASRVRELFDKAEKSSPCVIFIDEIDAIGRQRGAGLAGGNDEREQTLNQILTNMDGFIGSEGIIVIAATNRADILDAALTRPGRFDRKVQVGLPDQQGRKEILDVHFANKNVSSSVNMTQVSQLIGGFSGADIANLANEAAILSVRYNESQITPTTLLNAFEKITIGLPTQRETRSQHVLSMVAYHEIGHALVASMFPDLFVLQKVTIQSNKNGAGGYTLFLPKEPYDSFPSKKYLLANIMVALGGRLAEKVFYKNETKNNMWFQPIQDLDITTGASNDLKQANSIARTYVNLFGNVGIYDGQDTSTPFLGRELANGGSKLSEYSKEEIDKQIEQIVSFCYDKVEQMFEVHEDKLHHWSSELLKQKILNQSFFV